MVMVLASIIHLSCVVGRWHSKKILGMSSDCDVSVVGVDFQPIDSYFAKRNKELVPEPRPIDMHAMRIVDSVSPLDTYHNQMERQEILEFLGGLFADSQLDNELLVLDHQNQNQGQNFASLRDLEILDVDAENQPIDSSIWWSRLQSTQFNLSQHAESRSTFNRVDESTLIESTAQHGSPSSSTAVAVDPRANNQENRSENWERRLAEWKAHREGDGLRTVSGSNAKLANWVKRQRYQYKLKTQNKRSSMTDERQAKLEAAGFVWESHESSWDFHFDELRFYKASNNHVDVPQIYPSNRKLGIWVKGQRKQYWSDMNSGTEDSIRRERYRKLEALGFRWTIRSSRKNTGSSGSMSSGEFARQKKP